VLSGGEIVLYYGATVSGLTLSSGAIEIQLSSGGVFTEGAGVHGGGMTGSGKAAALMTAGATTVEVRAAQLIQAMATFTDATPSKGALFESGSGGALHAENLLLASDHHDTERHWRSR